MTLAWGKNVFYECVVCVCLTFGIIFLVIAFFMANRFLMGVMIYLTNWFLQISLEIK